MAHEPRKITELYAWICREADGGDGIPAIEAPNQPGLVMPMIGADRAGIESLRPWAFAVALEKRVPVRLVRFSQAEELEQL